MNSSRVEQVEKPFHIETEAGECSGNCLEAKEIKCICRCGGKNHGLALKQHVKRLDEFNDHPAETYEDPVEASFSPEECLEEMAILA